MDAALGMAGVTPVPGLSSAFKLFNFIVCGVPEVHASRKQIKVLASTIGKLLETLNAEFAAGRLIEDNCAQPLEELKSLLEDIHQFTDRESKKTFFKALLQKDGRITNIGDFYPRIGMIVNEFQITSLLNVQSMLRQDEVARNEDADSLAVRLDGLEKNQIELRQALDVNQNNMIAMMVSIQRRLETQQTAANPPEQQFYAHALEYLASTSGKRVEAEDWMIPAFEVDYGAEIGSGGFGTVYHGTWNRTEVAIKCVHEFGGATTNLSLLRKEIDVWLNLRHPNILQFLGANTLDDKPFIMMPYIPYNSRQYLEQHPNFDPIYILRDISLGLEYLHSRKICHGDLKGINVLVDDLGRAQLCDFGLSRIKADITSRTAQVGSSISSGSRNWMAPELFAGSPTRLTSDIYAFGMTLYELYTDEIPLSSIAFNDFVEVVLRMDVRPERPDAEDVPRLTDSLWDLAQRCWMRDPKARPSARQIHDTVAHLIKDLHRRTAQARSPSMSDSASISSGHTMESSSAGSPRPKHVRWATDGSVHTPQMSKESSFPAASSGSMGQESRNGFTAMHQTARDHLKRGRISEAEQLAMDLVEKKTRALGNEHPDTLRSMFTLAATYIAMADYTKARELTTTVMRTRARILGSEHPDTLRCMSSLAVLYHEMRQLKDAEQLAAMVLEKRERILGREHPETLASMHNVSVIYHDLGRLQEAARLQEPVLDSRGRILGADHPDTIRCMFSLAGTYHKLGRSQDAEHLAVVVLQKRTQMFGREHPDTLRCMFSLAGTYFQLRKFQEAEELAEEVLRARTKILGPNHPETVLAMHNLALIYYAAGKLQDTVQLAMEVIEQETRILGNEHPYTKRSSMLLDAVFETVG
ncbi:kinase-like domain-containing protein [Mycena epipterygia]|nr:kinase-like domain-containing protein [Mycena epipterygia]